MSNGAYKPENNLAQTIILVVIFSVLFCGGVFAFSFLSLDNVWPAAIAIGLCSLSFIVPMTFMNRSDTGQQR
ncbi:hypothetical protein [Arthrobacter sp. 35W]|uniref:hypothetical protein n=1 Tax=Arthrobacter sp. 35W TaxID=1132441 RepID=UPI0004114437|nr:hypothetical protein [Arthrobacter sp. 35W]